MKRLERYATVGDMANALFAAQARISSGDLKPARPGEGASAEEIANWNKENGVPEKPDGYALKLTDGLVVGEADKPIVDAFTKRVHALGWNSEQVSTAVDFLLGQQEVAVQQRHQADADQKVKALVELRETYGDGYEGMRKNVKALYEAMPKEVAEQFALGRLADGTLIGDSPAVVKWLADIAQQLNPVAAVMPGMSGAGAVQAIESELASLKKMMGDTNSEYWKGPSAQRNQARYRQLLDATSTKK